MIVIKWRFPPGNNHMHPACDTFLSRINVASIANDFTVRKNLVYALMFSLQETDI